MPACLPEVIGVAYDETLPPNTMMVNPRREQDINIRANLDFPLAGKEGIFVPAGLQQLSDSGGDRIAGQEAYRKY